MALEYQRPASRAALCNIFKWCNSCRMADADTRLNGSVDNEWSDCSASVKTQVDDGSSHSQLGLLVEVAAGR